MLEHMQNNRRRTLATVEVGYTRGAGLGYSVAILASKWLSFNATIRYLPVVSHKRYIARDNWDRPQINKFRDTMIRNKHR